jgi:4-carboxymuconolactone decarboxylase
MRILLWAVLMIAVVATASGQSGQGTNGPAAVAALPADIHPDTLNRLPLLKREQMDENGKRVYDRVAGGPGKIASPTGPASYQLYMPGAAEPLRMLNEYLRRPENLLGNALTELAILVAAREGDSLYLWSAHEPSALKAGVAQSVIDTIRNNKDLSGLGEPTGLTEEETLIIGLGRQLFRSHKLDSATFAKAVELFGRQGTVEMVTLMGNYTMNGLLLNALDQHLAEDRKPLLPLR